MLILNPRGCDASAVASTAACVGPVDAVQVVKRTGQVSACVLHGAILKAVLAHVRLYAPNLEGAALAAYQLANEFDLHGNSSALRRRAQEMLAKYSNVGSGR